MDTLQALNFTIERLDDTGHLFGVQPQQVVDGLRDVNTLCEQDGIAYAVSSVLGAILDVAMAHRHDCDRFGCPTCVAIRDGLAANLTSLRTLRLAAISRLAATTTVVA